MKKILVPFDFDSVSENALLVAANLANLFNSQLSLLYVYHLPVLGADVPYYEIKDDEIEKEFIKKIENLLKQPHFNNLIHNKPEFIIRQGFSAAETQLVISGNHFDLIVAGVRTQLSITEKIFNGSHIEIINECVVPLLLVPEKYEFHLLKSIGLACDITHRIAKQNFIFPQMLAEKFDANLFLFFVVRNSNEKPNEEEAKVYSEIEDLFSNLKHSFNFPEDGNIAHGITTFIQEHELGLLVMFPHHHTMFERLFGQQNTLHVTKHLQIPLLLIRDKIKQIAL